MKHLLLTLIAALALVGCQSAKDKSVSDCFEELEQTIGYLSPNDMRSECECAYEKYNNQDGNLSKFRASRSCMEELGLDKKIEDGMSEMFGLKKDK